MKRIGLMLILIVTAIAGADAWRVARPDYGWSFPEDHWARAGYKTEWWYFTGHLQSETGRRFGYQFTFFRVGLVEKQPDVASNWATGDVIMGHAAISDLDSGKHVFSEVLYRAVPMLGGFGMYPDTLIAWSRGPTGTADKWTLSWNGTAFDFVMGDRWQKVGFSLSTKPKKPLIFQGPNGFSQKGKRETAASQYYSFTRLETSGSLRIGGETFEVTGESWMDKEFGSHQLEAHQVGWDWFSLQLADGREVMLYVLRDGSGNADFSRGTVVSADGEARYLSSEEFEVQATATWKSSKTGGTYPSRWQVKVDGVVLTVVPEMAAQENWSRSLRTLFYWEGAVKILGPDGTKVGKGYVELVGYGTTSLPAI
ncbi:MAG: carotenoid 1,2-hydratase [bacterium]|nr:carotenoid 1,2-hydratase [bacterium]